MAILPLAEIAIRRVYPSGIPGSASWVQHLALWVGFLGAAIAARRGELLSLTAGAELLRDSPRKATSLFTAGVSFAVCTALTFGGIELVQAERLGGRELAFGFPVWAAQSVMPVAFALIGLRILWRASPHWSSRILAAGFAIVPLILWKFEALQDSAIHYPLIAAILLATMLGAPIFVGIGGLAAVLLWHDFSPVSAIPMEAYNLAVKPILPTIPLFTLAGYILAEGGTPGRLVELFRALFGWMPGGVAVVAIIVCAFFTSFTGGSGVTILAMGGLLFPMLLQQGYPAKFSTGLMTSVRVPGRSVPAIVASSFACEAMIEAGCTRSFTT